MSKTKTKLSVNINKIATLRNARGGNDPNVLFAAQQIQSFGAHGITVHPRPDERHIKIKDVYELKKIVTTEFNIEGYPSDDFIKLVSTVMPEQVTLVPDPPDVLTSNAGWNISKNQKQLEHVCKKISHSRISVFVDPKTCTSEDLKILSSIGVHRIELYTESYAKAFAENKNLDKILNEYFECANNALKHGLQINAGHDLNQKNLGKFIHSVPEVSEVSIGHAIISEALYLGLKQTIANYLKILDC